MTIFADKNNYSLEKWHELIDRVHYNDGHVEYDNYYGETCLIYFDDTHNTESIFCELNNVKSYKNLYRID